MLSKLEWSEKFYGRILSEFYQLLEWPFVACDEDIEE
jgi:hypothetical protein